MIAFGSLVACGTTATPDVPLRQSFVIGDAEKSNDDTVFTGPVAVGVLGDTIVVADDADKVVRLISATTRRAIGKFGRSGGGPGEFSRIVSMAVSPEGRIAVLDVRNKRISIFGRTGDLERELPLEGGTTFEIAFDIHERIHMLRSVHALAGVGPILVISREGKPLFSYGRAIRAATPLESGLQNQVRFARRDDGGMWILHSYTGLVERYDSSGALAGRFSVPLQLGQDTIGPVTVARDNDQMSIRRIPVAEDIVAQNDSILWVSVLMPANGNESVRSRIFEFHVDGTLRSKRDLETRASRITISDSLLYTLRLLGSESARIDAFIISKKP